MRVPQEKGNWKPYNVAHLERNITEVFRSGDIGKLSDTTYQFIILEMHFIAHYDLHGFRCVYADLDNFREMLQTGEHSRDLNYNLKWADQYEGDRQFNQWYGAAYCRSVANGIRRIVAAARNQGMQPALPFSPIDQALMKRR